MTQEIKIDKFEGVLVKVPEGNQHCSVELYGDDELVMINKMYGGYDGLCALPDGKWKLIGNPFELREEQWQNIVDFKVKTGFYKAYSTDLGFIYNSALDSGYSLLKSMQVFNINPYGDEPKFKECICSDCVSDNEMYQYDWEEAEERTGNWILLEKLNN